MANTGFNKSFEESFKQGQAIGGASALEAIKEKIKLDQTKAEEKYKATTLRNANMALATQFGSEDIAKKIMLVSEELGDSVEGQKIVSEFAQKMLQDKAKPNKKVYKVGSGNELTQVGEIPGNAEVFKESLTAEDISSREMARKGAGEKFFKEPEIADLRDISDTRDTLSEVRSGLQELGIKDITKFGGIESETVDSNLGPISIPARFNLFGQYAKDPKYTAVKAKLERAFNKYRKIITGAQASNQELSTLRKSFAAFTDRPEVFFENLGALEGETNRMLNTRFDLYEAVGRDTSKLRKIYQKESSTEIPTFSSIEELNAAKLPKGTRVKVGNQSGVVS